MKFGALAPFPKRLGGKETIQSEWLRSLKAAMGDAFTIEDESIVGYERIAIARFFGHMSEAAERLTNNFTDPAKSHELLRYWSNILDVPIRSGDTEDDLRAALSAKYKVSQGNSLEAVKAAISALLGNSFVELHTSYGDDLDNPPEFTIEGGASDPNHDLGGGNWSSARSHVLVEVQAAGSQTIAEVQTLVTSRLWDLMDRIMPAYATWDEAFDVGFDLDIDSLDLTAMTEES